MVGRHYWQGDVLRDDKGMPREVFPPLMDLDTWNMMRRRLDDSLVKAQRAHKAGSRPPRSSDTTTATRSRATSKYMLSGGVSRCGNCGGPLCVGPEGGNKRYRCDQRIKGVCFRGVSVRVEELDSLVAEEFLTLAGNLLIAEESIIEERPDASRRADLSEALRVARVALADAVEAEDDPKESAARAQVKALRAELDVLPADITVRRERVWSSETYAQRFARLDAVGRRDLIGPHVKVTVGSAERQAKGWRWDSSPEALRRRVKVEWSDELIDAAVDALDPFDPADD